MESKRIALVTGANKGIGLEIARQLGQSGVMVLMGARNLRRGQDAAASLSNAGLAVEAIEIDLNNEMTIAAVSE